MCPVSRGKAAVSTWSHRHNPSPPNISPWASCSHQGQQARTAILPAAAATCGQHQPFPAGIQVLSGFLELHLGPHLSGTQHPSEESDLGWGGCPSPRSALQILRPGPSPSCPGASSCHLSVSPSGEQRSPHHPWVLEPQAGWDQACPGVGALPRCQVWVGGEDTEIVITPEESRWGAAGC